jgi:hypothetical protein
MEAMQKYFCGCEDLSGLLNIEKLHSIQRDLLDDNPNSKYEKEEGIISYKLYFWYLSNLSRHQGVYFAS